MQCPFCLKDTQRNLGGILLFSPAGMINEEPTAAGRACNRCLAVIAQLVDVWMNGGINSFVEKLKDHHLIKEVDKVVEQGRFRVG